MWRGPPDPSMGLGFLAGLSGVVQEQPNCPLHPDSVEVGSLDVVGTVEEIEELRPELRAIPFLEFPDLSHRKIHVVIVWATEYAAACVTDSSVSGRSQNASVLHVAAKVRE